MAKVAESQKSKNDIDAYAAAAAEQLEKLSLREGTQSIKQEERNLLKQKKLSSTDKGNRNNIPNSEDEDLRIRSFKQSKNGEFKQVDQEMHEGSLQIVSTMSGLSLDSCRPYWDEESDVEVEKDEIPKIPLSKEEKKRIRRFWSRALVVKPFEESVGYDFLYPSIMAQWKPTDEMKCDDLGSGYYLIKFKCTEDFHGVLDGVPWFVGPFYLMMRLWEREFRPESSEALSITAVWARLPRLPEEYFSEEILERAGGLLGTLLKIDTYSGMNAREKYARICVQVDLYNPLTSKIKIQSTVQEVVYEGPKLCFGCRTIGHIRKECPSNETVQEKNIADSTEQVGMEDKGTKAAEEQDKGQEHWTRKEVTRRKPKQGKHVQTGKQDPKSDPTLTTKGKEKMGAGTEQAAQRSNIPRTWEEGQSSKDKRVSKTRKEKMGAGTEQAAQRSNIPRTWEEGQSSKD